MRRAKCKQPSKVNDRLNIEIVQSFVKMMFFVNIYFCGNVKNVLIMSMYMKYLDIIERLIDFYGKCAISNNYYITVFIK